METQYEKKITWRIKNFSSFLTEEICSDQFVVGDSKWRLVVYPKGTWDGINKCLSLYLKVADSESLPCGWKRHTKFRLTVVNQISEKLSQQDASQYWFDQKSPSMRYRAMLPLTKLHDKNGGFLVNGEVKIVAEVGVRKVVGKSDVLEETLLVNKTMDVNGFQVLLPSQVESVNSLFKEHPDIASNVRTKNPLLRTTYLNVLLSLIKILSQSPKKLSNDDLANTYSTLSYVTKGFKFDWLEIKLKEVDKTRVQEVEDPELKNKKQKCAEMEDLLEIFKMMLCDD